MRPKILSAIAATGLTFVLLGAAYAAPPSTASSDTKALVEAREELASRAAQTKGAPSAEYTLQRKRVDDLINALESGKRVDPSDIDQALDDAARPTPW